MRSRVKRRGFPGPFLPGEDACRGDTVEVQLAQRAAEEGVPADLALADVEVLVDTGGGAGVG